MSAETPRITPGDRRALGLPIWAFSRIAGLAMGTHPPAIFTILGRGRGLFWGWLHFSGRLMPGGRLPRRETELVILRVATLRSCDYELSHHTELGRRAGLTDADLARIGEGSGAAGWTVREATVLRAAEELVERRDLTDETWAALRSSYDERRLVEILLLVGQYDSLATTLGTLRLQPDPPR